MTVEWSTSPPDLVLRVDRDAPELLRDQLEDALRAAIRDGRLPPGERLPSSRTLAVQLGVARGVVTECYAQLQAEGYLALPAWRRDVGLPGWVQDSHRPTKPRSSGRRGCPAGLSTSDPACPTCRRSLATTGLGAERVACRDAPDALLGYGGPERCEEKLRVVLAGYLAPGPQRQRALTRSTWWSAPASHKGCTSSSGRAPRAWGHGARGRGPGRSRRRTRSLTGRRSERGAGPGRRRGHRRRRARGHRGDGRSWSRPRTSRRPESCSVPGADGNWSRGRATAGA